MAQLVTLMMASRRFLDLGIRDRVVADVFLAVPDERLHFSTTHCLRAVSLSVSPKICSNISMGFLSRVLRTCQPRRRGLVPTFLCGLRGRVGLQ